MKSLNSLKKRPNWYFAGARDSGPLLSHTASRYVIREAKKIVSLMWLCLTETFDLWQKGWEFIPRDARERNTVISVDIRAGLYLGCQWLKRSDGSCWDGENVSRRHGAAEMFTEQTAFEARVERRSRIEQTRVLHHLQWRQPEPWLRSLNGDKGGLDSLHKPQQICAL